MIMVNKLIIVFDIRNSFGSISVITPLPRIQGSLFCQGVCVLLK